MDSLTLIRVPHAYQVVHVPAQGDGGVILETQRAGDARRVLAHLAGSGVDWSQPHSADTHAAMRAAVIAATADGDVTAAGALAPRLCAGGCPVTVQQRRRRAADRRRYGPRAVVFVSYAHRDGDADCPCTSCRWERMADELCSACFGDMTPEPCPWCGGMGWKAHPPQHPAPKSPPSAEGQADDISA